jgi:hypothetical protein
LAGVARDLEGVEELAGARTLLVDGDVQARPAEAVADRVGTPSGYRR